MNSPMLKMNVSKYCSNVLICTILNEYILKNKPLHLCINLFVMLIDLNLLEVIKEEVVCHI